MQIDVSGYESVLTSFLSVNLVPRVQGIDSVIMMRMSAVTRFLSKKRGSRLTIKYENRTCFERRLIPRPAYYYHSRPLLALSQCLDSRLLIPTSDFTR